MLITAPTRTAMRVLAFAALTLASPVAARTVTVDQDTIVDALKAAAPGDRIVLSPGGYGVVAVPRKTWQTPITIDARKASLTGVSIFKASGVNWIGGTIIASVYGVNIADSANVTVSGANISGARRGIVINDSHDVKIQRNKLWGLGTDGIDVVGQRILVENNVIDTMSPVGADHPDGIQMWSGNGEQTRDITIRNNTITGEQQGIFGRAVTLGLSNITVTGNKVYVDYPNGIVLLNTSNSVATGNTVSSRRIGRFQKANMRVEGGDNNKACGNVVTDVPKALAAQPCPTT